MPKIEYRRYRPRPEARQVIEEVNRISVEYTAQGYRLSLRQVYYRMIARNLLPESWVDVAYNRRHSLPLDTKNTVKNYGKLKTLITRAREGGMIDWAHIVDRHRRLESYPHWTGAPDFLASVAPQYKFDMWENQHTRVEVWVEKDALVEVVARACEPLDVPYMACKGYMSASAAWEAAHNRFRRWHDEYDQGTVVIHLSDHDPSGLDMARDTEKRIRLFSSPYRKDDTRINFELRRIALTMDQVEEDDLPSDPAKVTDPRAAAYIEEWGDRSWELDAIEPAAMVELIEDTIDEYLDRDRYDVDRFRENEQRRLLVRMSNHFDVLTAALPDEEEEDED